VRAQVAGLLLAWAVRLRRSPAYVLVIDSGSTGTRMCARSPLRVGEAGRALRAPLRALPPAMRAWSE